MASTYQLINSSTISTATNSVTFSSIPATYTDLVLRISARATDTGQYFTPTLRFNSDTGTNYSFIFLYSYSSTTGSGSGGSSSETSAKVQWSATASDATANTFGNAEFYIPAYATDKQKPMSSYGVAATAAGSSFQATTANLWRNTGAINSIQIAAGHGTSYNFAVGSSFYLYGISNA
jgi:hypothetical protein